MYEILKIYILLFLMMEKKDGTNTMKDIADMMKKQAASIHEQNDTVEMVFHLSSQ
jgi:hypothetical protein